VLVGKVLPKGLPDQLRSNEVREHTKAQEALMVRPAIEPFPIV